MIEQNSLSRIRSLPARDSGHAIGKSYCHLGVIRGDRLFNICI